MGKSAHSRGKSAHSRGQEYPLTWEERPLAWVRAPTRVGKSAHSRGQERPPCRWAVRRSISLSFRRREKRNPKRERARGRYPSGHPRKRPLTPFALFGCGGAEAKQRRADSVARLCGGTGHRLGRETGTTLLRPSFCLCVRLLSEERRSVPRFPFRGQADPLPSRPRFQGTRL